VDPLRIEIRLLGNCLKIGTTFRLLSCANLQHFDVVRKRSPDPNRGGNRGPLPSFFRCTPRRAWKMRHVRRVSHATNGALFSLPRPRRKRGDDPSAGYRRPSACFFCLLICCSFAPAGRASLSRSRAQGDELLQSRLMARQPDGAAQCAFSNSEGEAPACRAGRESDERAESERGLTTTDRQQSKDRADPFDPPTNACAEGSKEDGGYRTSGVLNRKT